MKQKIVFFLIFLLLGAYAQSTDDVKKENKQLKQRLENLENQLFELKADFEIQKSMANVKEDKFKVYGYMGSRVNVLNVKDEKSPFNNTLGKYPYFVQSNLNLYFLFRPINKFKALAELRFYYGSEGKTLATQQVTGFDGTHITQSTYPTITNDPYFFDLGNAFNYKSHLVRIERAWMEYNYSSKLNFRLGHFVSPFGIWNVDHGLPVIISARIPFSMSYIPTSQTGLQFYGTFYLPHTDLYYAAYVSNGFQDANYEVFDDNNDKAVGGRLRLSLQSPVFKKLSFGGSMYHGLKTTKQMGTKALLNPADTSLVGIEADNRIYEEYMENVYGLDFLMEIGGFSLQSEYFMKKISYFSFNPQFLDPKVIAIPGLTSQLPEDNTSYYVQAYYMLPKVAHVTVSPYVRYENVDGFIPSNPYQPTPYTRFKQNLKIYAYGINIRQNAFVSYKLEYINSKFDLTPAFDFDGFTASATMAF